MLFAPDVSSEDGHWHKPRQRAVKEKAGTKKQKALACRFIDSGLLTNQLCELSHKTPEQCFVQTASKQVSLVTTLGKAVY